MVESEVVVNRRDELLSKRRLTMLSGSDGNLLDEDLDNEEIIEGLIIRDDVNVRDSSNVDVI